MSPFPPMLASLSRDVVSGPGWVFEEKYDGIRLLAFRDGIRVRLFSRNLIERTDSWPDVARAVPGTQLRAPFAGLMQQRGFSNGGRSLDIEGDHGYKFWAEYFGNGVFTQRRVSAGADYFRTTEQTQVFRSFGNLDMNGESPSLCLSGRNQPVHSLTSSG